VVLSIAVLGLVVNGLNLGLEFTGGSEFRVAATNTDSYESRARDAVAQVAPGESANITKLGTSSSTIRVQTEKLNEAQSDELRTELAQQFGVDRNQVSASFIGPSWGQSVSQQALRALVVFLVLTFIVMALYFRTWKMSVAAMAALVHDMVITVGIYAWTGFEVSPATMIGFLTVLGYSLYDTVVVFDKVRENTEEAFGNRRSTYAEAANLAVNQTVVRSINTTVVALLPIAAVLVMGFTVIGPGTLLDLSLVLFIGMAVGAYSSIFIATPLLATMRAKEPRVIDLDRAAGKFHAREAKDARKAAGQEAPPAAVPGGSDGEAAEVGESEEQRESVSAGSRGATPRKIHPYAQTGPRNQPKRTPKSRR
jgi:preprotein translocase subunit SecF